MARTPSPSRTAPKGRAAGSSGPKRAAAAPARGKAATKPAKSAKPEPRGRRGRRAKDPKRRSFLWRWRRGLFLVGLLVVASIAGTGFVLAQIDLPPARIQPLTTFVCTAEVAAGGCNAESATAELFGEENRVYVTLDEVPTALVDAVLSAEDRGFFEHAGVDPIGIARAAFQDFQGSGVQQGGSTITQQYVKLTYLSTERTIERKIKEAVLAIKLEQELSKEEILERYLNLVYFGRGAYGVGTAAEIYFGKPIEQLDLAESAYLAGLIRAPEAADAVRDPEEATRRRLTVLTAMLEEGYIDQAAHDAANAEPWIEGDTILPRQERSGLGQVRGAEYGTTYFIEYVRQQLLAYGFTDDQIYGGGLRVYTTLDHQAQQAAYDAVVQTLDREDDPNAALVAIDGGGYVRAMMAGRDFVTSEFNYATFSGGVGRQPGSSMKPFVLATALTNGISLQSRFNAPGSVDIPRANGGNTWHVSNYGGTEQGVLDLIDATRVSSNTVYAQLMMEVGPDDVVALAHRMGIDRPLDAVNALVLGTEEVSPLEMAEAYTTFANEGEHIDSLVITRVERSDGTVFTPPQAREQAIDPAVDAQVVFAMRGVVDRGTATSARLGVQVAGKTGTTQDNRDAWFIGFLPNGMTAAVWMGYEPNPDGSTRYMSSVHGRAVTGGSFPAEIWHDFMANWLDITGADVGRFPSVSSFPGEILGSDLSTTTSSLPTCSADTSSTAVPCQATSTSSSTSSSTTDTSAPPVETTASTAPPPVETTTTAPPVETTTTGATILPN